MSSVETANTHRYRAGFVAGLFMSRTNRPPMSIAQLKKFMDKKEAGDKIAVVVGSVTDDVRMYEVPKMTVCALRFSETARARITKAGGECLTFDQLALRAPTGENTLLLRGAKSHRETAKHFGAPGAHTDRRTLCAAPPLRGAPPVRLSCSGGELLWYGLALLAERLPPSSVARAHVSTEERGSVLAAMTLHTMSSAGLAEPERAGRPGQGMPFSTGCSWCSPFAGRCSAFARQAVRQGEGPQVREGPW